MSQLAHLTVYTADVMTEVPHDVLHDVILTERYFEDTTPKREFREIRVK